LPSLKHDQDPEAMSPLADFLDLLLQEGRAVFRDRPEPATPPDIEAANLLRRAFANYRLRVAGPPIDVNATTALAAGALVYHACWFLVSRTEPESELERLLTLPGPPRSPAEHLSADLVLCYLPQIYRRAKALNPADRLTALLADILRRWPLSGVLTDIEEGPLTPVIFNGHPGLLMLYAERLTQHERLTWVPNGLGLEYLELVYAELGKAPPDILQTAAQGARIDE
jgi:hypothetical protein